MKYLDFYKRRGLETQDQVFDYLMETMRPSIIGWEFFVSWKKVRRGISDVNTELNILNSLLGSKNITEDFKNIVKEYPKVREALPLLIATRTKKLAGMDIVLNALKDEVFKVGHLFNSKITLNDKDEAALINFFIASGLMEMFEDRTIKNLVDYCYGVEVGLDSNGRKNRSGTMMQDRVEVILSAFCREHLIEYIAQAGKDKIKEAWGIDIPVYKSDRKYDFVVRNKYGNIFMIETNFYGGGGSKLKSTAGEYKTLQVFLRESGISLVWITDGLGWTSCKIPLSESFQEVDYVLNLKMLSEAALYFLAQPASERSL